MPPRPRLHALSVGMSLFCVLAGCGTKFAATEVPAVKPADVARNTEVVAVVDGDPILVADVARQALAAGTGTRAALDALIDERVLSAEARRQHLADAPSVREAAQREMVRRYLALGFEREVTPAAVTPADLARSYQKNINQFDHPEMIVVLHILAPSLPTDAPERREAARRRATQVAARARSVTGIDDFRALATTLSDGDVTLKGEEVATGRVGWTVRPFADAAFALDKPGATSDVVETRFGFHVIYLKEKIPAVYVPLADVADKLREGLWPEVRRRSFGQAMDTLVERHHIEVYASLLDEAQPAPVRTP